MSLFALVRSLALASAGMVFSLLLSWLYHKSYIIPRSARCVKIGRGAYAIMTLMQANDATHRGVMDDEESLVITAQGGDLNAFTTLVERYDVRLFYLEVRMRGDG